MTVGTHRSEYTYDGLQHRVQIVEKENSVVQNDTRVVWCDGQVCEQRTADGTSVTRRAFRQGEQVASTSRFFTADHLGSLREVTDSASTLLARYEFDPWGRRSVIAGTDVTMVGFTKHRWQPTGGLWLALYRAYDPSLGIWLSADPIGIAGGPNLYVYALSDPVRFADPVGLKVSCASSLSYEYDVKQTRCKGSSPGCTWASMEVVMASVCKQDCGKWKFDGSVKLKILVQFAEDPKLPSSDTPGATLKEHEGLHVTDWQQWCSGLGSKYPSEGFASKSSCDRARSNFLKRVPRDFLDNLAFTGKRDAK